MVTCIFLLQAVSVIDVAEVLYVNTVKYVTLHLIVTACGIQTPFCGLDSLRVSWLAVQN